MVISNEDSRIIAEIHWHINVNPGTAPVIWQPRIAEDPNRTRPSGLQKAACSGIVMPLGNYVGTGKHRENDASGSFSTQHV
jgi:hypothetical protein